LATTNMPRSEVNMETEGSELIPRRKLYQDVVDRLIDMIRTQQLAPGTPLPSERDLILRFGVGRPALREALITLEQMGFIQLTNGRRAKVVSPTANSVVEQMSRSVQHMLSTSTESLENLKSARLFFEVGMARIAAKSATKEDIEELEMILATMDESRANRSRFQRADLEFHSAIARVSRNGIFTAVSRAMLEWLWAQYRPLVVLPGAEDLTYSEHREILERIKAHDADGAADAITKHVTRSSELYRRFEW
jgi:DNA-binding FadR family transcriptional regulator